MSTITATQTSLSDGRIAVVRTATADDAEQTLDLYRSIAAEGRLALVAPDEISRTVEQQASRLTEYLDAPHSFCVVAEVDGQVVGMAAVDAGDTRIQQHFGDISDVYVERSFRQLGIGSALMSAITGWAESDDQLEKLGLFVFSTSEPAIRLYKKFGFEIEGRARNDMKFGAGDYADTVIMRRAV